MALQNARANSKCDTRHGILWGCNLTNNSPLKRHPAHHIQSPPSKDCEPLRIFVLPKAQASRCLLLWHQTTRQRRGNRCLSMPPINRERAPQICWGPEKTRSLQNTAVNRACNVARPDILNSRKQGHNVLVPSTAHEQSNIQEHLERERERESNHEKTITLPSHFRSSSYQKPKWVHENEGWIASHRRGRTWERSDPRTKVHRVSKDDPGMYFLSNIRCNIFCVNCNLCAKS